MDHFLSAICGFLRAFVIMVLWNWFVVPLGMKPLGYWHTAGISMLMALFTYNTSALDVKRAYELSEAGQLKLCSVVALLVNCVFLLLALAFGSLYHYWM